MLPREYVTKITRKGSSVSGAGRTADEAQKNASEKHKKYKK